MALRVRDYDKPKRRSTGDGDDRPSFSERTARIDLAKVPGRRRKEMLTRELIDVYARVLNDATQEVAANAIGFSVRTIANWIAKGQDEECEDELLIYLADVHAYVMANGNRKTAMEVWREHTLDDPKAAMEYAKAVIPSLNVPKVQKIDLNATANRAPSDAAFAEYSEEEIAAMAHLERLKLKRLSGG